MLASSGGMAVCTISKPMDPAVAEMKRIFDSETYEAEANRAYVVELAQLRLALHTIARSLGYGLVPAMMLWSI